MEKIDGVTNIQTDIANRTCTFEIEDPDSDYATKLAEFAETNTHLAEYTIQ